uniref:SAM domain-containing protein n=1 Tax=Oryzias sinensis TaxID=183150 RepID=A0A8C7WT37_9TELE
ICCHQNRDPVVWTCHRVMKWIRDIDLKEFADNLQGKGVHGAVIALDPSFDTDALAKALGIPNNKHMLHRHLYEEMKSLSVPPRCAKITNVLFIKYGALKFEDLIEIQTLLSLFKIKIEGCQTVYKRFLLSVLII